MPSQGASTPQWVTPAVRAQRFQHRTFDSTAAQSKVSCHIYTPELHDTEKERPFPVLYWLHGLGDGFRHVGPLAAYFDAAIRAGKVPPMLIVFPNGLPNSMWCDSKDGRTPMETCSSRNSFHTLMSPSAPPPRVRGGLSKASAWAATALRGWGSSITRLPPEVNSTNHETLIKRLRGLSQPQYRLRWGEVRVFYDATEETAEVLAIVTKAEATRWLAGHGTTDPPGRAG
mgnify:CR=1 FL=1